MGGKRPDQHNLDPGEGRATDYKFTRTPADGLEETLPDDSGQPIKPTVPSPQARNPGAKQKPKQDESDAGE
jgi:hypothetical protein